MSIKLKIVPIIILTIIAVLLAVYIAIISTAKVEDISEDLGVDVPDFPQVTCVKGTIKQMDGTCGPQEN